MKNLSVDLTPWQVGVSHDWKKQTCYKYPQTSNTQKRNPPQAQKKDLGIKEKELGLDIVALWHSVYLRLVKIAQYHKMEQQNRIFNPKHTSCKWQ